VRVLYSVTAYPREPGDVITPWLIELIGRLRGRGVQVEVLAPSYRGLGDQVVEGVRVHRFRYAPAPLERLTHEQTAPDRIRERPGYLALVPPYIASGAAAAARLARTGSYDLVHVFWPVPHGLFGMAARRASGIPLVSTFFGVELRWLRSSFPLLAPVVRRIVRSSDAVTVISTHTARELRRLVPEAEAFTIPFGAAAEVAGETRWRGRVSEDPLELLFVGRLVERKGVAVLLEALARVRSEVDVRLTVVGDGPLLAALTARAQGLGLAGAVEFTGAVSDAELSGRLEACDALVLPAVEDSKGDVEGLGVVLIEALLHERPVIASASGGIVDIVRDGETGLLVPPGDPGALAGAIRRYRDEPELAARLARAGRDHVEKEFSWESIVDRLLEVYDRVLQQREAE
jgi:glycosyltransferase involved in cell wall biosynthesis